MPFKAIFFDMDGVLIDSMQVHVDSWRDSLKEFGFNSTDEDFLVRGGMSFKDTIREIAKINNKNFDEDLVERIHERKNFFLEEYSNMIIPFDINNSLISLKEKGMVMFVVTASPKDFAKKHITNFFGGIFDKILSREDYKNAKPAPDPFLKALELSMFKKDECVVIEDSPMGIKSAKKAGIKAIAITTSVSRDELNDADEIFESHSELFEYLQSNIL